MSARRSAHEGGKAGAIGTQAPRRPSVRLAIFLAAPVALSLVLATRADAFVYWGQVFGTRGEDSLGSIGRANLDGSDVEPSVRRPSGKPCKNCPTRPFIGGASSPCGVAVDREHVYWTNQFTFLDTEPLGQESIGRASLEGTDVSQSFVPVTGSWIYDGPCGVAVNTTHVYWANYEPQGTIGRANLDGSGVDQDFIPALSKPCGVAVDDTHVYWADSGERDETIIGRANFDRMSVEPTFITTERPAYVTPCGIAVDDTYIYWANTNAEGGTIGRANLDGSGVDQSFISGGVEPCGVAVDDAHVYWANRGTNRIGRANLDGSGIDQDFATTRIRPCGVAVDGRWSFRFGKLKRNKNKGTARLAVDVPRPGELVLAENKKVRGAESRARRKHESKLLVKPKGKAKKLLNRSGKAKVKAEVAYTPDGGEPNTQSKRVRLIKRR